MNISGFVLVLCIQAIMISIAYLGINLEKYTIPTWIPFVAIVFIVACIIGVITG